MEKHCILLLLLLSSLLPINSAAGSLFPSEALPTKSGYLPINNITASAGGSALFFAFYEAQNPKTPIGSTPLLVWLQGGPGCSSLIGNFFELGPFLVSPNNLRLRRNPASWNRLFGLLFIDNPLGVGFSAAASAADIPTDQPTVARHLWEALQSFLSAPSFRSRPLFLTGESYAGKYVPAAAYHILRQNPLVPDTQRINLAGVAIGNGLTHPVTQVSTYAAAAYYSGLLNGRQREHLEDLQREAVRLTAAEEWSAAADARTGLMGWLQNTSGLATLYDLTKKRPYPSEIVTAFLNSDEVRVAIGVAKGAEWVECSEVVGRRMHDDVMKSVKYAVEVLLKESRVLLYQGIFDLRDGAVSTEAWVRELAWEGIGRFLAAERKVWELNGERAGYVQRWGNLTNVVVAGAGHLVPADQGTSAQVMIEDWVLGRRLFGSGDSSGEKKTPILRRSY